MKSANKADCDSDYPYPTLIFNINWETVKKPMTALSLEHRQVVWRVKEEMEDAVVCESHQGSPAGTEAAKRSSSELDLHTNQSSSSSGSKRVRVSNEVTD